MVFKNAAVVQEQIKKCVRCGQCRSVCPIFREHQTENYSPRGQVFLVQMLRDGVLPASNKTAAKLGECLLCGTCSSNCPSAIPVTDLVVEARSYVASQRPSRANQLIFDGLWAHPSRLRKMIGALGIADTLGLRSLARILGLTRLLPGDLPRAEKILARIPKSPAHRQLPALVAAQGAAKSKVAYFLGCGTDLLLPEVAVAAVRALSRAGAEVVIPPSLHCCGLPHLANGRKDLAAKLAARNLLTLAATGADYVVSDCASCTSALNSPYYSREGLSEAAADGLLTDEKGCPMDVEKVLLAADWLKGRVIDVNVMLTDKLGIDRLSGSLAQPVRVTYHDPCHLAKAQKIRQQPRQILQAIDGIEFKEMAEADACCGGSGTFGLSHYDLSMKILDHKISSIRDTGADIVATSCPSCITQLSHGLREAGARMEVVHPLQLLIRSAPK